MTLKEHLEQNKQNFAYQISLGATPAELKILFDEYQYDLVHDIVEWAKLRRRSNSQLRWRVEENRVLDALVDYLESSK